LVALKTTILKALGKKMFEPNPETHLKRRSMSDEGRVVFVRVKQG
jgi:hypothetical protein